MTPFGHMRYGKEEKSETLNAENVLDERLFRSVEVPTVLDLSLLHSTLKNKNFQ